ncbi:MAG: TrkA-N domain protein [Proteobacteria bacterium]|nr:TrkA-N domain protein [Pseudomonadota bacterium]
MKIKIPPYVRAPFRRRFELERSDQLTRILHRIAMAAIVLVGFMVVGTIGFYLADPEPRSLSDALYMTIITVTTVGYGEVVPVNGIGMRLFVGLISIGGFGTLTFLFTSFSVFFLEADLDHSFRRRRMQKQIDNLNGHFIVCGFGRVGRNVASELMVTGRKVVVIEFNSLVLQEHASREPGLFWLHGDGTDDDMLMLAGIERAAGVFAVISDDAKNLMVSLTAKQLNPQVRVVARSHEVQNSVKIRKAGADAVVLPDFTGGLRIVSMMVRPHVVGILDDMMRSERNIRMEEIPLPTAFSACSLGELALESADFILVAIREGANWHFNPANDFRLAPGLVLVVMATPDGRRQVEAALA